MTAPDCHHETEHVMETHTPLPDLHLPPYLLVVDLEATCDTDKRISKYEMETIEIGAVLVETHSLAKVGELGLFVQPVRHPVLSRFCTELTTIQQSDVETAPRFPEAIAKLRAFLADRDALFCSWGDYDKNQLAQDAQYHRVALPFGSRHLNLKKQFSATLGLPKKLGMGQALEHVGLKLEGTHHRGIDDARNIARLLPWLLGRARR
jgi:inhibitor of KinA sporulation pathway (predicted exonuclease)